MLQSINHLCSPLLDSLQYGHVCLVWRSTHLDAVLQKCAASAEQGGRIASLDLLATLLLMQPSMLLAAFVGTLLACVQLGVQQNLYGLFCKAAFGMIGPQCALCLFVQPVEVHLNHRPLLLPIFYYQQTC